MLRSRGATAVSVDRAGGDIECDVTDDAGVPAAVEQVVAQYGRLDILVNNAGIGAVGSVEDTDLDEWRRVFDVNLHGTVRMSRAALPHLRRSPSAAIVNTGSIASETGLVKRAAYSASKAAVEGLTRAMAADLIADRVRVNAVAPGTADTPWVQRLLAQAEDRDAAYAALVARQPIGRLVSADEIAHAICYLASPLSGSTTGTVLSVDGGVASLR
jgi:NAD(P)-dependent dehydrogenase (short-subunit alcohol dehydrogenase family)